MARSGRSGEGAGRAERLALQGFAYGAGKGTRTPDPLLGKPKARGTPVLPEPRSAVPSTGFSHALPRSVSLSFLLRNSKGIANEHCIDIWPDRQKAASTRVLESVRLEPGDSFSTIGAR